MLPRPSSIPTYRSLLYLISEILLSLNRANEMAICVGPHSLEEQEASSVVLH
jgi:hypothetical protein